MTEINPPYVLQASAAVNTAKLFRRAAAFLAFEEGVGNFNGANDLKVSERGAGANMSVDVARGGALVKGDDTTDQGLYFVYNDATVNKVIEAADGTNPRKDIVIAEVNDNQEGQPGDNWAISVVTGTPAGSPAEPTLPPSALKLAVVDIPALDTTISNAQITDSRTTGDPPVSVFEDGVYKGTEPKINLTGSLIDVTDNPGAKRVDITENVVADKSWNYYKHVGTSYYASPRGTGTILPQVLTNDTLWAMPYISGRGGTIDRMGIEVTLAGSSGSACKLGIYSNTSDSILYPLTLLLAGPLLTNELTGVMSGATSFSLSPGILYWLTLHAKTVAPTTQQISFQQGIVPIFGFSSPPATWSIQAARSSNVPFDSGLPIGFPAGASLSQIQSPMIGVRYGA